jgi:hypothetical protein
VRGGAVPAPLRGGSPPGASPSRGWITTLTRPPPLAGLFAWPLPSTANCSVRLS